MSLRHTLLGILDWVPAHGYALREMCKGYSWLYPMTNTNIYPALRDLENERFVTHTEQVVDGRLRKVYSVTEAGRGELLRWLRDPIRQPGTYRDPTLLKLCLLRDGAVGEARTWLEEELESGLQVVRDAEAFFAQPDVDLPYFTRLVAEHGLALARFRTDWLAKVIAELEGKVAEV